MVAEDNRAVVRRYWEEVFGRGDLAVADELFAAEHVVHDPNLPEEARGPEAMKAAAALARRVSPDLTVSIEDEIADGDRVVTRWTATGTLAEEIRYSGGSNGVRLYGITIFRVSDGVIQETWQHVEPQRDEADKPAAPDEFWEWLRGDEEVRGVSDENYRGWPCVICPWCCKRLDSNRSA